MRFYLGTHEVAWLGRTDVALFISHRRLALRKRLPIARGGWALDSGGFTELNLYGRWKTSVSEYVEAVERYSSEIGGLEWAAPMDWMCEPHVLEKTGLSVREHQERTVANYLELAPRLARYVTCPTCGGSGTVECGSIHPGWCENDPCHGHCEVACPTCTGEGMVEEGSLFVPVLQGQTLEDYEACAGLYGDAGVDLWAEPEVGLGTVCRRGRTPEIAHIVSSLASTGLRLHGFGMKSAGLARVGHSLVSADSMAWSTRGRMGWQHDRRRQCGGEHRGGCANCLPWALKWRDRVVDQLGLFGDVQARGGT